MRRGGVRAEGNEANGGASQGSTGQCGKEVEVEKIGRIGESRNQKSLFEKVLRSLNEQEKKYGKNVGVYRKE